jgi:hypothetical protein
MAEARRGRRPVPREKFSLVLKQRTAALHRHAEAPLRAVLADRHALHRAAAAAWLHAEAARHQAQEATMAAATRRHPALVAFDPKALRVAAALRDDSRLVPVDTADHASAAAARRLAARFRARLAFLARHDPAGLGLHAYVFGLARLYGGRLVAVLVARAAGLEAGGLRHAPPPGAMAEALPMRRAMDHLGNTPAARARLLAEARWAYAHGGELMRLLTQGAVPRG